MSAFDKIVGYDEVKRKLSQVVDMVNNYHKYERLGAKLPHGIILYGQPGVGKTMLATALLKDAGVPCAIIRHEKSGNAFCEHIKATFEEMAGKEGPSIILLDDLDKFSMEDHDDEEFAVVQACIDSVKDKSVFVVATVNDMSELPASLRRSGRFDEKILVNNPEGEEAVKIITHYMEGVKAAEDINYDDIAKMLSGNSCAALASVINQAAIEAAFENKESIEMEDFVKATLTKVYGLENRCGEISAEKKEEIAYHEAGHAVIAEVLKAECMGMVSLSSNSLGDMGGFALRCKQLDRRAHEILVSLGGKAASEMKFGRLASGTSSDLESAIRHLVCSISNVASLGMNQLELPRVSDSENYLAGRENVVHAELERYMFKAKEIIAANREFLDKIAAELLEKHTLLHSDIKRIRSNCTIVPAVVG